MMGFAPCAQQDGSNPVSVDVSLVGPGTCLASVLSVAVQFWGELSFQRIVLEVPVSCA